MPNDPIVEADALHGLGPVRYLDARDQAGFDAEHAPNAVRVGSDAWDAAAKAADIGFHNTAHWQAEIGGLGVGDGVTAVVYDAGGMTNAARVWFMIQHFGGKAVIVNGGWPALAAASALPMGAGPAAGGFQARPGAGIVGAVDRVTLRDQLAEGKADVYDTRTRPEYTGDDPRKNARPGHLPGARHLSHVDLMENGFVKPAAVLRGMLDRIGFEPNHAIVTHCEGGGRATLGAVAAVRAGFANVRVYYPSFSDWSRDGSCPVVRD